MKTEEEEGEEEETSASWDTVALISCSFPMTMKTECGRL